MSDNSPETPQLPAPVTIDDIRNTSPRVPEPDERARQEQRKLDHTFRTQQAELGLVGKLVGCNQEKPGNISFIAIAACLIMMAVAFLKDGGLNKDILTPLSSIITLSLGYLFGSAKNKSDE